MSTTVKGLMAEERFAFISDTDKAFIVAFDEEMMKLGYGFGGTIGSGYCWGRYMIIYSKAGAKNRKVIARVYIRDGGIVLRLFFSKIDAHRAYIESSPPYIKEVFAGEHGSCNHCKPACSFRKTYTVDDRLIEKCSGVVFEFWEPSVHKLPDYMNLLSEFYPARSRSVGAPRR